MLTNLEAISLSLLLFDFDFSQNIYYSQVLLLSNELLLFLSLSEMDGILKERGD